MTVTLSSKFKIVIPKEVRERLHLKSGQKIEVFCYDNRIQLIPIRPIKQMQGFLKGMDTTIERERTDRV